MNIFVNFPIPPSVLERAKEEFTDVWMVDSYGEADAYLIETEIPPMAPRVRIIQTITAGVNHIMMDNVPKGVTLCSNAGAYSDYVAEHAMALLLSFYKKIPQKVGQMRKGIFAPESVGSLKGKKMTIIGYGGIGKAVASLAKSFKMEVRAYGRRPDADDGNCDHYTTSLTEIFGSNVYVIALPFTKYTKGLIDATILNRMGPHAVLVNVARADIVEKEDLIKHCEANGDFHYLTDVWWDEPDVGKIPWRNIIATPHIAGGISEQAFMEALRGAIANIGLFFKGRPANVVNREEYEGIVSSAPALRKMVEGKE